MTSFFPAELWLARGTGDGDFPAINARVSLGPAGWFSDVGALGDFDGDGQPDIAIGISNGTPPSIAVTLDHSYAPDGPLLDLGQQLEGARWPIQIASGSFDGGQPFAFALSDAAPSSPAFLIVGFTQLLSPFKGGVMVPFPSMILGPFATSPGGEVTLAGTWPTTPSGVELDLQFWMPDPAGPAGFAASSGVRIVTP